MLKTLFHRESLVIRSLEAIGLLGSFFVLRRQGYALNVFTGLYLFLLLCYLIVRLCDWIHWYPGEQRGIGIEVHFRKSRVPCSYILAITSSICLLPFPHLPLSLLILLILVNLMMLAVVLVNGIQIYFHLRDKDPLPINYFSLNKHLREPHE